MMGLLVLIVLGFYLALSIYVIKLSANYAQRRFGRAWVGGVFAGLVMYNLVFWDAIPTWYTHHRLCSTEAGLKVYQTPEDWAKENPERYQKGRAANKRVIAKYRNDSSEADHSFIEYPSGLVFEYYNSRQKSYAFNTDIRRERVTDKITGKILFEEVEFYSRSGKNSLADGANSFADYKFWTVTGKCAPGYPRGVGRFEYNGMGMSNFLKTIEGWDIYY